MLESGGTAAVAHDNGSFGATGENWCALVQKGVQGIFAPRVSGPRLPLGLRYSLFGASCHERAPFYGRIVSDRLTKCVLIIRSFDEIFMLIPPGSHWVVDTVDDDGDTSVCAPNFDSNRFADDRALWIESLAKSSSRDAGGPASSSESAPPCCCSSEVARPYVFDSRHHP